MIDDLASGDAFEVETLAAREHSGQHFMYIGCSHDKDGIVRWLLQSFKQGIEGFGSEHVGFVKDVDFVFASGGGHHDFVTQVTDTINTTIGGGVNFDDVK